MEFLVPEEKIKKLLAIVKFVLQSENCNAKEISQIAGRIISMSLAIGPLTRLFTRQMYRFIDERRSWYEVK